MIVHKSGRRFTDLLEDPLRGWLDLNNVIYFMIEIVSQKSLQPFIFLVMMPDGLTNCHLRFVAKHVIIAL